MGAAGRAIVIGMLIAGMLPLSPLFVTPAAALDWPSDHTVSGIETHTGETIFLSGNLTITGTLTFSNVELVIQGNQNGDYHIEVQSGGTFLVQSGSRIHSWDSTARYSFYVRSGSTFAMDHSTLEDCGWTDASSIEDRGLCLQTGDASVTNSTVMNNCNGIGVSGSVSPFIYMNDISGNDQSGIYLDGGASPAIDRNTISGNMKSPGGAASSCAGIYGKDASPVITYNTISGNRDGNTNAYGTGIKLSGSGTSPTPVVEYNDISGHNDSQGWGLDIAGCNAYVHSNNITMNANGARMGQGTSRVDGNRIETNFLSGPPPTGYGVNDVGHNSYTGDTISSSATGVFLGDYSLSTFYNCEISGNGVGLNGDALNVAFSTSFINCTFKTNSLDVHFDSTQANSEGGVAFFTNTTFDTAKVVITDVDSNLQISWYMRVSVIIETGARIADLATVKVFDKKNNEMFTYLTDSEGRTPWMTLEQRTQTWRDNATRTPYNVTGRKNDLFNWTVVDLTGSREVTVVLDDNWPSVTVDSPADNATINRTAVNLTGTASPGAQVFVNGLRAKMLPGGDWTAAINLTREGPNDIRVRANDGGRNEAFFNLTLIRDITPPIINIGSPLDHILINSSTVTVSGNVSETNGETTINGNAIQVAPDGSFSVTVDLIEGDNTILIVCRDAVWNTASVLRTVEVDTIPPELVVTEPARNVTTNASVYIIRGYTELNASLTLNGQYLRANDTDFNAVVGLVEGDNYFIFNARDRAGNNNTVTVDIFRDTTPPDIIIVSPKDSAVFNTSSVEIRGMVEEGATVKVNGVSAPVVGGTFSIKAKLDKQGKNLVRIEAWDALNNRAEKDIAIYLDTVAPELRVTFPPNNFLTDQKNFEMRGKTEKGANLTVNGRPVLPDSNGLFDLSFNLNDEGPNSYEILAQDPAGNIAQTTLTVIRDTVLFYNISTPRDGTKVKTATVLVIGSVEANSTVLVNGKGVSLRPDHTFITEVSLSNGKNTITIEMVDRAGNNATVTLTVIRQTASAPSKGFIPGFGALAVLAAAGVLLVLGRRRPGWKTN
jgi:parallel beta-helix repeat protein